MITNFPPTLNDGTHDYTLVRQYEDLGNGIANVPLYERVPKDDQFQFTPDLPFCVGQTTVPVMQKIPR